MLASLKVYSFSKLLLNPKTLNPKDTKILVANPIAQALRDR